MRNFRELVVWQEARILVKEIYTMTVRLPAHEKFGLISQMTRCAVSIPSNIAEGSGRATDKDFVHFLHMSMGSLYELETLLLICLDIQAIPAEMVEEIIPKVQKLQSRLTNLIQKTKEKALS